jgi:mitogen-activated protein kinase 1/3
MQVALKRIPDVLNNAENAKRVLREVCILRRLSHPHIITLSDVFLKPSSTGQLVQGCQQDACWPLSQGLATA